MFRKSKGYVSFVQSLESHKVLNAIKHLSQTHNSCHPIVCYIDLNYILHMYRMSINKLLKKLNQNNPPEWLEVLPLVQGSHDHTPYARKLQSFTKLKCICSYFPPARSAGGN